MTTSPKFMSVPMTPVKQMHEGSEKIARERGTRVTVDIVRKAAESFTPARFKAKFAAIFDAPELDPADS